MTVKLRLLAVQIAGLFIAFAAVLFLPAGTIAWPAGWMFLILFLALSLPSASGCSGTALAC